MRFMKALSQALPLALLLTNFAMGADSPSYKDGVLTIPSVNTVDQVGKYQDVTFKLTEQGNWQLLSVRSIGTVMANSGLGLTGIDKIEVVKTDTFPVQVFLRVTGGLDDCFNSSLGQVNQRLEKNRFDVAITFNSFVSYPAPPPGQPVACLASIKSFVRIIPLAVYGLSAGIYSYSVNNGAIGGTTGTFELTADNKLPGDY